MSAWQLNTMATSAAGVVTETKEHSEREAAVNLTDLGDGTAVISLSLLVPAGNAQAWAEALLREHGGAALRKRPSYPDMDDPRR